MSLKMCPYFINNAFHIIIFNFRIVKSGFDISAVESRKSGPNEYFKIYFMICIFPGAQFPVLTQFIRRCLDILKYNGERLGAGIEEINFQFLLRLAGKKVTL